MSVETVDLWIGGKNVPAASGKYFDDRNPLDDSVFARAAEASAEDVDKAVQTAHAAFQTFKETTAKEREGILCRAAEILQRDKDDFARILIDEVGSPTFKAYFEIEMATDMLRAAAGMTRNITGQTIPSDHPGRFSMSVRAPLGVVASITPFNVPMIKGVRLSCNPIACGNTVVLLPSEESPMLARRIADMYKEAGLPDGVFNVVTGFGHDIGDSLTSHPLVKVVTFTGSSVVGAHIRKLCAEHDKRVILELGGKSPLVIMDDADLESAVAGACRSIFVYQGQVCMGASRIYVQRGIYDRFRNAFKTAAEKLGMGDLRDQTTILGPIISERQRQRVLDHIEDARSKGATVVTGGEWEGNRCKPTILENVDESMTVFANETFGPVTSIYPIETLDEALEKSNDSEFGLSAAIYTSNLDAAMKYALNVESGMVHVNAPTLHDEPHVPFGGVKNSGTGREGTIDDIETMTEWKWITIQM